MTCISCLSLVGHGHYTTTVSKLNDSYKRNHRAKIGDTWLSPEAREPKGEREKEEWKTQNPCRILLYSLRRLPPNSLFIRFLIDMSCSLLLSSPIHAFESSRKIRRARHRRSQILCFSSQPNLRGGEDEEQDGADHSK